MWCLKGVLYSIFIIYFSSLCSASVLPNTTLIEEAPIRPSLVEAIVKRVSNISLSVLSKKRPEIKAKLILQIQEKLNKSAQALGEYGADYVKCIMRGVMAKAFEPPPKAKRVTNDTSMNTSKALSIDTANKSSRRKSDVNAGAKAKEELMRNIAGKMQLLTNRYLSRAKTPEERAISIEYIKEKFKEFAEREYAIHGDIKKYEDLISKGFDLMMKKNGLRRMVYNVTDNNKDSKVHKTHIVDKTKPTSRNIKLNQMCGVTLGEVCQKINLANTLKCHSVSKTFNILKLCDGEKDCVDSSDENQCTKQALKTVQNANQLVTFVDTSMNHDCYNELVDKTMIYKQNSVISSVLKTQLTKLEKHSIENSADYSRKTEPDTETNTTKEMIQETATVVNSLISALGMLICPNYTKIGTYRAVDSVFIDDFSQYDYETSENRFPLEVCKCNGQFCLKQCSERCSKICHEMYSLSQLSCEAVSGEDFVSFDSMCDGKFECYDETDERDCFMDASLSKFEATNMYNYILKTVEAKVLTVKHELIRSRLQALHAVVKKFQMLSLKKKSDISEIKTVRQEMFDNLMKVYDGAARFLKERDLLKMHFYLLTLKERLVSAVKRSNTGNKKIVSANSCLCRGFKCALTKCSKSCDRACAVEPKLTRFFCSESIDHLNNSLPIELICNGKVNCPNGEDEKGCRKELCRPHHLTILRRKLQDSGKAHSGILGETLKSWRIKVTATLSIAEGNERPTPPVLHEILRDILHDLVTSYASMEGRDNAADLQEYYKLSRLIIDTLKSCNV